ncbi:MAG: hypothetical protein EXR75_09525 [Myxococcales bacterium]|nr:hypothetical protein [Myxococcales bacterium]
MAAAMHVIAFAALAVLGACSLEQAESGHDVAALSDVDACGMCHEILIECASSSAAEADFAGCRDQWSECRTGHALPTASCGAPTDGEGCTLCLARFSKCEASGATACGPELETCKSLLIGRADVAAQCRADKAVPLEVACGICEASYSGCMTSTAGADFATCQNQFEACRAAHGIVTAGCEPATGEKACSLCQQQYDDCSAAGAGECQPLWNACTAATASSAGCVLSPHDVIVHEGGEPTAVACTHEECSLGTALVAECSLCATTVCQSDPFCCESEWDSLCVDAAAKACGCGAP